MPLNPGVPAQVNVSLIVLFNYYYTFLQLDPKDMADQLKRAGGAIPAVRPGRATADYITKTLNRMSILGSAFLGALAAAPPLVEAVTGLQVRSAVLMSAALVCTKNKPVHHQDPQSHVHPGQCFLGRPAAAQLLVEDVTGPQVTLSRAHAGSPCLRLINRGSFTCLLAIMS